VCAYKLISSVELSVEQHYLRKWNGHVAQFELCVIVKFPFMLCTYVAIVYLLPSGTVQSVMDHLVKTWKIHFMCDPCTVLDKRFIR
jgi:hypothetical protein